MNGVLSLVLGLLLPPFMHFIMMPVGRTNVGPISASFKKFSSFTSWGFVISLSAR